MNKLDEWLDPKYLSNKEISKINKTFIKSKPYPNLELRNFFKKDKISKLKNAVSSEKFEKVDKDLFSLSHTNDLAASKNKAIREFYGLLSSNEFISLMQKLTKERLSQKIDMQAHLFEQGDYLLFHDDVVEGRKIAYIVYLSNLSQEDGGELQLFDIKNPKKPSRQIAPEFNLFACFKVSEKSIHAVGEIISNKRRLAVGGWFYGN
ncbi:2OG-Fe(II) oxygenase [Candidatus Woesearchaeota archaeon]|nr:2OG-Fe(II) oxygenase [Candidatus Woesearchaeota archaeon]